MNYVSNSQICRDAEKGEVAVMKRCREMIRVGYHKKRKGLATCIQLRCITSSVGWSGFLVILHQIRYPTKELIPHILQPAADCWGVEVDRNPSDQAGRVCWVTRQFLTPGLRCSIVLRNVLFSRWEQGSNLGALSEVLGGFVWPTEVPATKCRHSI